MKKPKRIKDHGYRPNLIVCSKREAELFALMLHRIEMGLDSLKTPLPKRKRKV